MVPTSALLRSPGHPFYAALNKLLADAQFDAYVEGLCEPLYRDGGRPSIPPGVFFRMLFIGNSPATCTPAAELISPCLLYPSDAADEKKVVTLAVRSNHTKTLSTHRQCYMP